MWKSYFIGQLFSEIEQGSWIVCADASLYYQNDVKEYLQKLVQRNIDAVS